MTYVLLLSRYSLGLEQPRRRQLHCLVEQDPETGATCCVERNVREWAACHVHSLLSLGYCDPPTPGPRFAWLEHEEILP
jgi:hypothetical protein